MLRVLLIKVLVNLRLMDLQASRPAFAPICICPFIEYPNVEVWIVEWGKIPGVFFRSDYGKFFHMVSNSAGLLGTAPQ